MLIFEENKAWFFLCESSAKKRIHLKHQVLFPLKNNEEMFMNVVCCSRAVKSSLKREEYSKNFVHAVNFRIEHRPLKIECTLFLYNLVSLI